MSSSPTVADQNAATRRRAGPIRDAILLLGFPLLGVGLIWILDLAGMQIPVEVSGYSGAQLAGFVALGLLASVVFLVGPWLIVLWQIRKGSRRSSECNSAPQ